MKGDGSGYLDELLRNRRRSAVKLIVIGIVQGVGFRPFVYQLARRFELHYYEDEHDSQVIILDRLPFRLRTKERIEAVQRYLCRLPRDGRYELVLERGGYSVFRRGE